MLADPLSIPIDAVEEKATPVGEPVVLSRIDSPGPLTVRKIAASESPLAGSVAEKLQQAGLRVSIGSTESGKGLGKTSRTMVDHSCTPVETDGTVSNLRFYTVCVAPTDIARRPVAMATFLGMLQEGRSFMTIDNYSAIQDGQR